MNRTLSPRRRALSLLLTLSLVLGLLPGVPPAARAAESEGHWADSYLSQLVEWGFIRADQSRDPDKELTRADFMSIVNRAYGYHETGPTPFEDIDEYDWFYDDVGIAYTAQYIKGTSPTTASPEDTLDRETAATILGRNMMLQESPGELVDFSDARDISNWARGTIKSSMEHYLVTGYEDGTFRPQQSMNWGEIAALVTRTIGTPLQDEGDYSLGGVFGNVTVTSPGVTLRDTVISGDLYITGGVGSGGIKLENVTVLGRIIASGTGSSEGGASILMRNVTADELLVDNLADKEVSIRADGITEIGRTTVRTSAYIEDNTPEGLGLHSIVLDGEWYGEDEEVPEGWEPPRLTLAGRIEEVTNRTPNSTVHAAKGTVSKLTVDETAVGSHVIIDRGTVVKDLILDTGVDVTGEGDVTRLEVNAPGCDVEMLPDQIVIRPGITAIIAGNEMDSSSAEEFLLEPMILAGYPKAQDIAPTSLEAVFATNKQGRIYWAVSAITDGSIGADDLIKPPSYGNKAVRWGTVDSPRGNEEVTAQITGLTSNGSYYLSAVLEDAKGQLSPVKVISFTTPDNTVPAFNTGYPYMSKVSRTDSVVVVSVNKDCKLYYALLPEGAAAPTENELKTSAVAGALGYGVRDVQKNVEDTFRVNDVILDEQVNYVLYLWLVDADGANKSPITSLTFTTDDETPPEFIVDPSPDTAVVQPTSVGLTFRLNENGTVYWVAVPAGTLYPKAQPGTDYETAPLTSDYAKLQVASGLGIGADGKAGKVTAVENKDGTINVTGLKAETYYDFYYVAKDNAGPDRNYSVTVKKITIHTQDSNYPTIKQSFYPLSEGGNPRSTSDIYLDISEDVIYTGDGSNHKSLVELYAEASKSNADVQAINRFASALAESFELHKFSLTGEEEVVKENHTYGVQFTEDIIIDYTKAKIEDNRNKGQGIRIIFPGSGEGKATHLENGKQYCFLVSQLTDSSDNDIQPDPIYFWDEDIAKVAIERGQDVPVFMVDFPGIKLTGPTYPGDNDGPLEREGTDPATALPKYYVVGENGSPTKETSTTKTDYPVYAEVDKGFKAEPDSTSTVDDNVAYDLLLRTDTPIKYNLYYRVLNDGTVVKSDSISKFSDNLLAASNAKNIDENGWMYLGNSGQHFTRDSKEVAKSLGYTFNELGRNQFPKLVNMKDGLTYEFAISLTEWDGTDRGSWHGTAGFAVSAVAGYSPNLRDFGEQFDMASEMKDIWAAAIAGGLTNGFLEIGSQKPLNIPISMTDSTVPEITGELRIPSAESVTIEMFHSRAGTKYYAISDVDGNGVPVLETTIIDEDTKAERPITKDDYVPVTGENDPPNPKKPELIKPENTAIYGGNLARVKAQGSFTYDGKVKGTVTVPDLEPNTTYYIYYVLRGDRTNLSKVYIYQFTTPETSAPKITDLTPEKDGTARVELDIASYLDYRVFNTADLVNIKKSTSEGTIGFTDAEKLSSFLREEAKATFAQTPYSNYSILQALLTPFDARNISGSTYPSINNSPDTSKTNYTVFDVYASPTAKREVYNLILSGRNSGFYTIDEVREIYDEHNIRINMNQMPYKLEPENIFAGNNFHIFTMARSQSSDPINDDIATIFSFRAAENLSINDQDYPRVMFATCIAEPASTGTGNVLHKGTLTLGFSKDVYLTLDNGTTRLPAGGSGADNTTVRDFLTVFRPPASYGMSAIATSTPPTMVFDFDFTSIPANGSITIPPQRICAFSGGLAQYSIQIQFSSETSNTVTTYYATVKCLFTDDTRPQEQVIAKIPLYDTNSQVNMYLRNDDTHKNDANVVEYTGGTINLSSTDYHAFIEAVLDPASTAQNIVWSSSDTNVATVSSSGTGRNAEITATGIGTTTIIATLGGDLNLAQKTIQVTVAKDGTTVTTTPNPIALSDTTKSQTVSVALPEHLANTAITCEVNNGNTNGITAVLQAASGTINPAVATTRTITVSASNFSDSPTTAPQIVIKGGGVVLDTISVAITPTSVFPTPPATTIPDNIK